MTTLDCIEGVSITNFRSIRGTVRVPLDAPIILVHGPNGAGKTSILSALELALTREIPAMKRDDPSFEKFLVHQGQDDAAVTLLLKGGVPSKRGSVRIENGIVSGDAFLDRADGRFFSDRCMLAQSVLSRLLKIYQDADPTKESALTHFVKDLLKLDQLEAVIDGLHDAGDVRNVRKLTPHYKEVEDLRKAKRQEIAQLQIARDEVVQQLADELKLFQNEIGIALPDRRAEVEAVDALKGELRVTDTASRLLDERGRLSEIASIEKSWAEISTSAASMKRSEVEASAAKASLDAGHWRGTIGVELEAITGALREFFPDLPSWSSTSPDLAYAAARKRVEDELGRLRNSLASDKENAATHAKLLESIAQDQSRLKIIASQIADISASSNQVATVLSALLPHIQGNLCPVCERNFGEVSKEPLAAHVQKHIAQLTADAGRLFQLSTEQTAATVRASDETRQLERIRTLILSDDTKLSINRRIVALTEHQVALNRIRDRVADGARLLSLEAISSRELGRFRESDRLSNELRAGASRLSEAFGAAALTSSEQLGPFLVELRQKITEKVDALERVQRSRESALTRCGTILKFRTQREGIAVELEHLNSDIERLDLAIDGADSERRRAKDLASIARESRTKTVRNVFNNSLNTLWRDLFVRLAPTEPFIPAFRIPSDGTDFAATLETVHRKGMSGGTPGSMLSSGNLNTAALTLFLALHFSVVTSRLPWLVLDDPVQSMDELHIAQFAALLRTIARNQRRKIIMSVHERPLFDYLSLELSPAFETDKLLTLEIQRGIEADTQVVPTYLPYEKDAVAA